MRKIWGYFYIYFFFFLALMAQEENSWLMRCLSEENPTFFAQLSDLELALKKELVCQLIPYLKEEKMHFRCQAARSLGVLGRESVVAVADLRILLGDSELLVRMEAAHALFLLNRSEESILYPFLLPAFQQKQQLMIRIRALEMLEEWKSPATVSILLPLLKEAEWTLRRMAVRVLGKIASKEGVSALNGMLQRERNVQVLQETILALREIEFLEPESFFLLEGLLLHPSLFVRIEVSQVLEKKTGKKFGYQLDRFRDRVVRFSTFSPKEQEQFIEECMDTFSQDGSGEMRLSAAEALLQIQQEQRNVIAGFSSFLKHHDSGTRLRALKILNEFALPAMVPLLVEFLQDPSRQVRYTAASILGKLGKEASTALPALFQSMSDPDDHVRMWSVWALGQIDREESFSALQEALRDSNAEVRRIAQEALNRAR